MRTIRQILVLPLALLTVAPPAAFAQSSRESAATELQHLVPPGQLAATVAERVAAQDAKRATIREALGRPEVRDVAASMHLDLARAEGAIETMSGVDLEQAANAARSVNQQLVGGATSITFNVTTIIIILLLVILLIVAIK